MAKISEIKLPNNSIYQLKDNGALQLTGGTVTGPVNFEDSVYISDLNAGNLVVTGNAAFTNNIQANTINGVEVGSNPKFTDTWNKVSTTQDGYVTKLPGNTTSFLRGDGSWATPPDTTYVFDGTYNSSTNKVATVNTVTNAINNLDGNLNNTTPGVGKTLTAFSQTNGKISATFGNISITKSQISDFPSTMTPAAHTHDDRYYTETEINNKFTALTNTTTQINYIKFYSGSCNAGKTYIGWIKIASFPMNNSNQLGPNSYEFGIYRSYTSPSSESYNIKINTGWDNASIIQLNGRAGTQIIEKFRLVKDNTNHICYFEMYVNTNNATYQNNVNLRIQQWNYDSVELTLLNTVQTEAESDFQVVSTLDLKPEGIVSNSDFYGNATSATKATQDESGNNIKTSYASSLSINGTAFTLKSKSGATLSTITFSSGSLSISMDTTDKKKALISFIAPSFS